MTQNTTLIVKHNLFIKKLKQALTQPLPGPKAQLEMAPQNLDLRLKPGVTPRKAAVLALLYPTKEQNLNLIFTQRTRTLHHHSGEICFPGGAVELTDRSLAYAALRETNEEIGIPAEQIEILGQITPLYIPPSKNLVYPFIGWTPILPQLHRNPDEVEKILHISLKTLLDPQIVTCYYKISLGQKCEILSYQVNGAAIWGATGMILSELLTIIRN
ncbi:MAG: CoA pyrophosphatase, partial [Anaerolineae bacterium]|nr:CoA pyrophosphatase [Anaerolineae bacterium]